MKRFLVLLSALVLMAASLEPYAIFSENGKSSSFKKLLKACEQADVVLFGELHNNTMSHWLQLELTKALHESKEDNLVLAAEMFERDDQLLINEYLSGDISTKNFEKEAKLWPNYKTDYKPLMSYAKEHSLHFVASNIPRRYASKVAYEGLASLEKLSSEAKEYIAPFPIEVDSTLPGYAQLLKMDMGPHGSGENFMSAQAIKDATMAHSILENYSEEKLVLHYNGAYHSNNFEGISWYLKKSRPELNIVTISSVEQEQIKDLGEESQGLANFIIVVDEDVTKTY